MDRINRIMGNNILSILYIHVEFFFSRKAFVFQFWIAKVYQ